MASATGFTYGTMDISPAGPYDGGEVVTITYAGLDATESGTAPGNGGGFFAGLCVGGGNPQAGTGGCGTFEGGGPFPSPAGASSTIITGAWYWFGAPNVIANGSVRFQIPERGAPGNFADYPGYECDNTTPCNIVVGDFAGDGPTQVPIVYNAPPVLGCEVIDEGVDPATATYTDSGASPTASTSSVSKSSIVVDRTAVAVTLRVNTLDDCLGNASVVAKLTGSNGKTKSVPLTFDDTQSDITAEGKALDSWKGTASFTNADRVTWTLGSITQTPLSGNIVLNAENGGLLEDNSVEGAAEVVNLASPKTIKVVAYTKSTVDAAPEPITLGKTLTVTGISYKASGASLLRNNSVTMQLQVKVPGSSTWKTIKTGTSSFTGRLVVSYKPSKKGTWSFRTVTPARTGYAASISPTDFVSVR
jgi:hypothetical protein